jgi:hypothetical protein
MEGAMIRKRLASRLYFGVCCFVVYFVAASASFNGYYDKWHFGEEGVAGEDPRFHFEMMVDGTAYRPYVYRQLLPTAANWIDREVPASIKTWLYGHQALGTEAQQDAFFDSPTAENPVYFFRYLLVYLGTFGFALLGVYAMQLVCRAMQVPLPAAVIAPAIVILLVPYLQSCGGYFYDYPELAFFALAAWVALKFDWWWILPIAVLGTWNKESFLLSVPTLYPLLRRRNSRLSAWLGIGVLCLACVVVYLVVRSRFAQNPGGALEVHWRDHLEYFMHPRNLLIGAEKTYGMQTPKAYTLGPMLLLAWIVWRAWGHLPREVQRHAQIAAAINLPLYFLFCWPGELRDLSLLYVAFLLVVASTLNDWMNRSSFDSVPLSS